MAFYEQIITRDVHIRQESTWLNDTDTERYRYNTVGFHKTIRNKHPIAHPWGWDMDVFNEFKLFFTSIVAALYSIYRQISNIIRTLVGNKIVDHSDVVGASPVGAAPTTSSFST